jgi:drug/metabolite transporter (DMT)-like permease
MLARPPRMQRVLARTTLLSLYAIFSAACWGLGTVLSRRLLDVLPSLTLLLLQLSASVLFLSLLLKLGRQPLAVRLHDLRAGWPGLLEPGLAYLFGTIGLALTTASNATLISALEPLFIVGLAWAFLRERLTRRVAYLAVLAVVGMTLVSVSGSEPIYRGIMSGDMLVLLGTISAAGYVVLTRRLLSAHDPLALTRAQQVVGLLGVGITWLIAALLQHPLAGLPAVTLSVVLFAAASGVVQYALAFWLYLIALHGLPATTAAFYLTLIPLFGVAGAYVLLGEQLTLMQGIGAACILATVILLAVQRHPA